MPSSSSSSPEIYAAEPVGESHTHFSYKDATQEEVLEDLSSRFILNLPDEELNSLERLCFQVEQAHWFYEDFIREENTKLPSMPLKRFSEMLFHACPLLQQWSHDHEEAFKNFMQYKTRVPVCGAIMLNDAMDKCLLVKGWKSSSNWGFPKGKINETEPPASCAVREVLEETGYNLAGQIDPTNMIELTIKEQKISLFIVPGVPEDFNFQTKTRKEISQIAWFNLSDLPTWKKSKSQSPNRKFYLISPFIGPLKNFINERRRRTNKGNSKQRRNQGSNGPTLNWANGIMESYPNSQIQSSSSPQPNISENELGPELSRLFSGLTTRSHKGGSEYTEISDKSKAIGSTSDDPSDSSIESPIRTRAQLSSSRQSAIPTQSSEWSPLHKQPSRIALNAVSPHSQVTSEPHPFRQPTALPLSPRRASGTADISPYLSSKTELPVSAKTLQHLQLLETVADESARMAARAARVRQGAASDITPLTPSSNPHDLIYSSNHANHVPTRDSLNQQNPFQLRSRTSQSFNRPTHNPSGSMTLHQNHLLAVINGARSVPITPIYPFLQQPQPPLLNSALPPTQPLNSAYLPLTTPHHSYPQMAPPIVPPPCSPISGTERSSTMPAPIFNPQPAPTSNSVPPLSHVPSANVDSNPITNMGPLVSNPLLSILNGRPT